MQFSAYDHKKLVVENRDFGFGFRYEKNLDALHGIRWFNAEVELANVNQTPYIYRVTPGQVIINAPPIINRLDAEGMVIMIKKSILLFL